MVPEVCDAMVDGEEEKIAQEREVVVEVELMEDIEEGKS
jgi:hypothetical protein